MSELGAQWLHDLPAWLAQDPALNVVFYPGWETRSRSSGGFVDVRAVAIHHTASPPHDPKTDTAYMWLYAQYKPIGNVYLARDGVVYVGAAGASNTMGKGGPLSTSKGAIPLDYGNSYMFAIEAANDGMGEVWPEVQMDAYIRLVAVLCKNLGLDPNRDIFSHHGYCEPSCPGRKIDPRGPTPSHPTLGGTSGLVIWPDPEFRKLVIAQGTTPPPVVSPPPGLRPEVPIPTLQVGSKGNEVTRLINVLKFWKWYPAEFMADTNDGSYGARCATGVTNMQQALGSTMNGVYDLSTAEAYSHFLDVLNSIPPSGGLEEVPTTFGMYFVQPRDSYWRISTIAYGTGTKYEDIQKSNDYASLVPGDRVKVPNVNGEETKVQSGEGPYTILRRCDVVPTAKAIEAFYAWNGGAARILRPGDAVFVVKP